VVHFLSITSEKQQILNGKKQKGFLRKLLGPESFYWTYKTSKIEFLNALIPLCHRDIQPAYWGCSNPEIALTNEPQACDRYFFRYFTCTKLYNGKRFVCLFNGHSMMKATSFEYSFKRRPVSRLHCLFDSWFEHSLSRR